MACSPKAVSPQASTAEVANGRDDVDGVGVVLGDLENDFSHVPKLFGECPWLCSEGEMARLKMEDFDCFMSIRAETTSAER